MEIWHFRLSQLANSSKHCKNSLFQDVFKVSAPSLHTSSKYGLLMEFCGRSSHIVCKTFFSSSMVLAWVEMSCIVQAYSSPNMVIKRIKVWWVWWPFVVFPMKSLQLVAIQFPLRKTVIFRVIVLHGSVFVFSFFFFRFHYMDFPDCLLLLLSISVSTF